jgi:hypothetical protein
MDDALTDAPQGLDAGGGLIGRLQQRGQDLAKGRRLTMPMPGWENLSEGRGLWARFKPFSRGAQSRFAQTPDSGTAEMDVLCALMVDACEEVLIGNDDLRTPLADEAEIASVRGPAGPLVFGHELGSILGVGGDDGVAVLKRMLVRGDDDLALFSVAGELLQWSGTMYLQGVETAAGE